MCWCMSLPTIDRQTLDEQDHSAGSSVQRHAIAQRNALERHLSRSEVSPILDRHMTTRRTFLMSSLGLFIAPRVPRAQSSSAEVFRLGLLGGVVADQHSAARAASC